MYPSLKDKDSQQTSYMNENFLTRKIFKEFEKESDHQNNSGSVSGTDLDCLPRLSYSFADMMKLEDSQIEDQIYIIQQPNINDHTKSHL